MWNSESATSKTYKSNKINEKKKKNFGLKKNKKSEKKWKK